MKILVITNLYPPDVLGGYEMGCKQAVDALRGAGHDVYVLAGQPRSMGTPPTPDVNRRLKLVDVYDHYFNWKEKPLVKAIRHHEACNLQAANVHVLADVLAEFQPDVAYVWNVIGLGGLGLLAALQHTGTPWVMHLMDDVPRSLCAGNREGPVMKAVADTFVKLCRGRFICCSQTTVAEIVSGGVDIVARTRIIPNWVTTAATGDHRDYMRGGKLRIIQAGAMSTAKGVHLTIEAAHFLREMGVDNFEVDLYGPGTDPGFQIMVQTHNLAGWVNIKGTRTQKELYALYPEYDVFCFPTWAREPFAFAPTEAMAFGCLGLFTRASGNAEWFIDGLDCLKCDRDSRSIAAALAKVARGQVPLAQIAGQGRRLIAREYRLEKVLPKIEAVLSAAAAEGGGPARPAAEAYHVALLAEKTFQCLMNESAA